MRYCNLGSAGSCTESVIELDVINHTENTISCGSSDSFLFHVIQRLMGAPVRRVATVPNAPNLFVGLTIQNLWDAFDIGDVADNRLIELAVHDLKRRELCVSR